MIQVNAFNSKVFAYGRHLYLCPSSRIVFFKGHDGEAVSMGVSDDGMICALKKFLLCGIRKLRLVLYPLRDKAHASRGLSIFGVEEGAVMFRPVT